MDRPIAILGGGNAGHCMAADLTLGGFKVNFYEHPNFKTSFQTTLQTGMVEIIDVGQAKIHKVTMDMADALDDVELIMVVIPAMGHELFFNTMLPHLKDGQVVTIAPGNFGSLLLSKLLRKKGPDRKITICEANTMPYATRRVGPARVTLLYGYGPCKKPRPGRTHVLISALPARDTELALRKLQELFPAFSPAQNVLATSLSNPNLPIHPMGSLLNTGRIEHSNGNFHLYKEGITPSVLRAQRAVFEEIVMVGEAFGIKVDPITGSASFEDYVGHVMGPNGLYAGILGPKTPKDRYVTEDIPYGVVPTSEMGKKAGMATPLLDALVAIASVVCQEDYRRTGRTLESLGLDKLSKEQIISLVKG